MTRALPSLRSALIIMLAIALGSCGDDSTGPLAPATVTIVPDSISLIVGGTRQLGATVRDRKGTQLTESGVTWSTVNTGIASVTQTGLVTAVSAGRAVIMASSSGKSGEAVIHIDVVPVASLTLSTDSAWLAVGSGVTLNAVLRSASGALLLDREITWTSSDITKATVASNGAITAVGSGIVVIRAASGGQSDSAVVSITGTPDFAIVDAQVTQGVQSADGSIPVVLDGNAAVLNVVMRGNLGQPRAMQIVVRVFDASGGLIMTDTVTKQGVIDASPDYAAPDAQFLLPTAVLAPGRRWQVVRDPRGVSPDDSTANDVFPRSGTAALATVTVPTLDIHFVPIALAAHAGETGRVTPDMIPEYVRVVRSVHPLGTVVTTIEPPLTTFASFGTGTSGGDSPFWLQVLRELDLARVASNAPSAHWYGVLVPPAGFTFTIFGGFGYIPTSTSALGEGSRTAVGVQIGWFTNQAHARELVAHELGHNFGRRHAPCGGAGSPDPAYPIPGGTIGRAQHDVFAWATGRATSATAIPASTGDIMGYCDRPWGSEYTYRGVLAFRGSQTAIAAGQSAGGRTRVLVIRGTVENGRSVAIDPAFAFDGHPMHPREAGSYRLEGRTAGGSVVFSYPFEPTEVDHAPNVGQFLFAIPMSSELEETLAEVVVRGPAGAAALTRASSAPRLGPGGAPAVSAMIQRSDARGVALACANAAARGILVLDATTGAMLATGSGASVRLAATAGAPLTMVCTDGVRSTRQTVVAP